MFQPPKLMSPEDYRNEYLAGYHQSEYNKCRFADDKLAYAKDWLRRFVPAANFDDPHNLVDRICNLKLYDYTKEKEIWADKISAMYELHRIGLSDLVLPTTMWSRSYLDDTLWANLPNGNYILKCCHGSGWNMKFIKDENFVPDFLQASVWNWVIQNYAYIAGYEKHYEHIQPGFIIQPNFGELLNWEFWCENGNIIGVNIQKKLNKLMERNIAFFDKDGKQNKWCVGMPFREFASSAEKEILKRMIPYVERLADGFKFVRVDLYSINSKVKFGELTFTPSSGRISLRGNYE